MVIGRGYFRARWPLPRRGVRESRGRLARVQAVTEVKGEPRSLPFGEGLRVVAEYHWRVYARTWRGSIFSRFLSPLLFLLAMGVALGSLVDGAAGGIDGVPYLMYVAPAMVAVQAMMVAVGESTYPVYGLFKWNRMYHSMLATPLRIRDIVLGQLLVVGFHGFVASTVFVAICAAFGALGSWWALLCIPIGTLTCLAFAAPIFGFSARLKSDNGFNVLYRLVVTPLMLFSGAFFPVAQLPTWFQPIAWATPLWHGVELSRAASLGGSDSGILWLHLLVLIAFVAGGVWFALTGFKKRLIV